MDKLLMKFKAKLTVDNLWFYTKITLLFIYRTILGDLVSFAKALGRLLISKNWFSVAYSKYKKPFYTQRLHVSVSLGKDKEFRCVKYKLNGIWYYKTNKGLMTDEQLMSWLEHKLTLVKVTKNGKVTKAKTSAYGLDKTWLERHTYLTQGGYVISSQLHRAIDPVYKKHLLNSLFSAVSLKKIHYFKISTVFQSTLGLLSSDSYNTKLPNTLTKNYDYVDSQYQLINTLVPKLFKNHYRPTELLVSLVYFVKNWILSAVLSLSLVLVFFFLRDIPVNKHLFTVVSLGLFTYLLISGFVFFLKKYRYGKYTTAMHRFWRRSFSIFWALEGFLFVVFMYLTVLCNQEPFFMYDNMQFFKEYTYSWRFFIYENSLVLLIISILHLTLIRLKDLSSIKVSLMLLLTSTIYFFLTYTEFYQFYYTVSHYNPTVWLFDYEFSKWYIDLETTQTKRTRILLHFVTICLIAKFWHFVFILGFWIFSVSKWLQSRQVSFQLLGANLQNAVILYLLNWILMYPWIKLVLRKFLFRHYKWLFVNFRSIGLRVFFNDCVYYIDSVFIFTLNLVSRIKLNYSFLYYNIQGSDLLRSDFTLNLIK